MKDKIDPVLEISSHPFFIGLVDPDTKHNLPMFLPFNLGVHPRYAIPRLIFTHEIRDALNKAYVAGSMISTPLGESKLAKTRMNEMLEKLLSLFNGAIKGKKFLEVGCGNGELLNQLKIRGAVVTGLEIGPQANVVEERYRISVIKDPLTVDSVTEKFDCIYSYGCLEHIENIEEFFEASRSCLNENGLFFHSVPNAALSFENVQLDHLLHEHINYFTPANGVALFNAQGFCSAESSLTRARNELMLWGYYQVNANSRWLVERVPEEIEGIRKYAENLNGKINKTLSVLKQKIEEGLSIGFYAGGYEYGTRLDIKGIRYFDGDTFKHGKQWLKGMPLIESPEELIATPVDQLVVCKPHYFDQIENRLVDLGLNPKNIINIDTLASII